MRTHTCGELRESHHEQHVTLAGWVHKKRHHGRVLFLDLRDHYGLTQWVIEDSHALFSQVESLTLESVVSLSGSVVLRAKEACNPQLPTGGIEVQIHSVQVLSVAEASLPMGVSVEQSFPEETRLHHRYLDLRRKRLHNNIVLRSRVISFLRQEMEKLGFLDVTTPILSSGSPEGARDFVVPSRKHPGQFYALPQAPQQFKQLLMASGFDRYYQIAPCFRDEDLRANRSYEFYQLDFEMAFVTQEDVMNTIGPVLQRTFQHFAPQSSTIVPDFPCLTYAQALQRYGSDKPDLRNPLQLTDYTKDFAQTDFVPFHSPDPDHHVGGVRVMIGEKTRKFFNDLTSAMQAEGAPGLAYGYRTMENELRGPLGKISFLSSLQPGEAVFCVAGTRSKAYALLSHLRDLLGQRLELIDPQAFAFCWVKDFPMFERDDQTSGIIFSHNPFSMPQGGFDALENADPLTLLAFQYDLVVNGVELCSGAIRNHCPKTLLKAFEIAGYESRDVEESFSALLRAFRCGVPPHGGAAPGIDRIVMLLAAEPNIREVMAFPLNQQGQDLLMGGPKSLDQKHLKELHVSV